METEQMITEWENTGFGERLKAIRSLYDKLEKAQDKFCERFCVHCIPGCGSCCEHFTPDLTVLEAEFLAFGMIVDGKVEQLLERLRSWTPESITCPLYDWDDKEHHCMVYRWRPLVCRLFGASASEDKRGRPVCRKCKWNDEGRDISSEELEQSPEDMVIMNQYGQILENADPGNTQTTMLPQALENALAKIYFLMMLEKPEKAAENQT